MKNSTKSTKARKNRRVKTRKSRNLKKMRGGMFIFGNQKRVPVKRLPVKSSFDPTMRVIGEFTTDDDDSDDDEEKGGSLFSFLFVILVFFVMSHMNMPHHYNPQIRPTFDIFDRHGTSHGLGEISKSIKENMVVLSEKPEFRNILHQKIGEEPEDLITTVGIDKKYIPIVRKMSGEYLKREKIHWAQALALYDMGPSATLKDLLVKVANEATSTEKSGEVMAILEKIEKEIRAENTLYRSK